MQSGQLRHVVAVQKYDLTAQDSVGQPTKAWTDFLSGERAAIKPFSGREMYEASEKMAEATVKIIMRYFDDATERMRIVHDGPNCCGDRYEIYDVLHIRDEDKKHYQFTIFCSTGLTEG